MLSYYKEDKAQEILDSKVCFSAKSRCFSVALSQILFGVLDV